MKTEEEEIEAHVFDSTGDVEEQPKSESRSGHPHQASGKAFRWILVLCAFFVFSNASVCQISFGIFITELEDIFGLSRSMIGLIGAFRLSLSTMGGVFCGPLIPKYGCRCVTLSGILLGTVGNLAAAFTTDPITFMLTFGVLGGLGSGIAYLPTHVIIQQHFAGLASRPFAMGIASAGLSVFAMVFSPLTRALINTFGWRGALIFIAAWILQTAVPAAMYRPVRKNVRDNIPETTDQNTSTGKNHDRCAKFTSFVCNAVNSYCNPALRKVNFCMFLCGCTTIMFGIDSIYMRSVARAISVGMEPLKASFLVTISGPFSAIGRCVCGLIAKCFLPQKIFGAGLVVQGLTVLLSALFASDVFGLHAFFASCYAFCLGCVMGLQSTVVVDIVGLKNLPIAMSLVLLFTGIGRLIANPLIGLMFDKTGGYGYPFIMCGVLLCIGGCCVLSGRCFKKSDSQTKKDVPETLDISLPAEKLS